MPLLRSVYPSQTGTGTAALDAMRRTGGTSGQISPNLPAPTTAPAQTPGIFGAPTSTPTTAANAAQNNLRTLGLGGAATAVGQQVNPGGQRLVPTGAPGAGAPGGAPGSAQTNAAAGGDPVARPDLVTPTKVDTSRQDQIYADQLAQSDKDRDLMMQTGYNTISSLQRRNASNAALSGFSVGGGSYLAGQRQAAVAGINAFNQGLLNWGSQRQGIMGQGAGLAAGAANTNASLSNSANVFNAGREGAIADQKTGVQATHEANEATGSVAQVDTDYGYLFRDHNYKDGSGQYQSLLTAYKNSLSTGSPEEQAAAYQSLMDYITPIQHAMEEWKQAGGKDKLGDFQDWYNKYRGGR